jgi:putative ABC transport system substrate-binding protein
MSKRARQAMEASLYRRDLPRPRPADPYRFRTIQVCPKDLPVRTGYGGKVAACAFARDGKSRRWEEPMLDVGRREFITLLGGVAAWPAAARGQQGDRMRRIGVILPYPESDPQSQARTRAFRIALQKEGWIEGQNLRIDYRWEASDVDPIRSHTADLVRLKPDVILANSTPVVSALLRETRSIPIVFVSVSDPVGQGFVQSFARPGGNVTGFTPIEPSFGGKLFATLKEIAPDITRIASLYNPVINPTTERYLQSVEMAAALHSIEALALPVHTPVEIETALTALGQQPGAGLIVMLDTFVTAHRKLIMSLATRYRLPAIYPVPFFAREGALIAIGADIVDLFRRSASYVDRILKGQSPGDLPVQAPVKFEMVINLKTAKALGLEVPANLLALADEVIE